MAEFTSEQLNAALSRYQQASVDPSQRLATSAEDVFDQVGRAQERVGAAGHQADHYGMSEATERGAFAAVGQETRTNPVQPPEPTKLVDMEAATGGQPVVSRLETRPDNEQDPLTQTATHVGHTALEQTAESRQLTPPPMEAIGDILNGEPAKPERPFDADWAPPQGSTAIQSEHVDIQGRLGGF